MCKKSLRQAETDGSSGSSEEDGSEPDELSGDGVTLSSIHD